MANYRNLDVLDAAEQFSADINRLIDNSPRRLIHVAQLRDSAEGIGANISEGFGRGTIKGRNNSLRTARGEAEESVRHLKANYDTKRVERKDFWRLRNRAVTISKMIASLMKT